MPNVGSSQSVDLLVNQLTPNARVTVLTGAGVSAASGVPTFRGAEGLWKQHRAEHLATPEAFARDPRLVWEWYDWRRQRIAACRPNGAHEVLAAWSERYTNFTLITQNVDGLHERAGTRRMLRMHGSIWEVGASAVVYPAASLVQEALMHGAYTAEINLETTPASSLVDQALHGPAETILAEINERLELRHGSVAARGSR